MITRQTVLILGAGASVAYGFPLGRGLITAICNYLALPTSYLYKLLLECNCTSAQISRFQDKKRGQATFNDFGARAARSFLPPNPYSFPPKLSMDPPHMKK